MSGIRDEAWLRNISERKFFMKRFIIEISKRLNIYFSKAKLAGGGCA